MIYVIGEVEVVFWVDEMGVIVVECGEFFV